MLRRLSLLGVLTAVTLLGTWSAASPPGRAADGLDASKFELTKSAYSPLVDDLDSVLPNVSVSAVIRDTDRSAHRCVPQAAELVAAFCWDEQDSSTQAWYPQAITTTADANARGTYAGSEVILASWYDADDDGIDKGVRLTFVDWSDPSAPTYRHTLLVEPYTREDGKASFRPIELHAGGMFWYGDHLYLADTWNGFRVFDLRHIWRVATGDPTGIGLQPDGTYQAHDLPYVVPQVFTYTQSTTGGALPIRFSAVSLDRTTTRHSLVVPEYGHPGGGTRLVRFPLDRTSRLLTISADGRAQAIEAYDVSVTSMQGAASIRGKYYLSTSDGTANQGDLATYEPGGAVRMHYDALPIGPEDLSYWPGRDELWSLTEHPNQRSVFAIRPSAY
ncbi:hypothetical protein SAMN05421678_10728 [Actinopolymorpha cephalotaxi]|uniref:Secreted protein n=1 Tax=Actinopolymorpha cephalotaxi TaxID=504797 RepID=A0A1I2T5S5_9ACTN|nr:hypothetical protein [Actinopolymorpha cephalotaxi]NYH82921.1 hypothetical protein [Actinopolymorpha cephalotaxi]SFG59429.1 hypothetical protein SAMN05421678_10728 [Actinopolymorpha cephalotaxi]